MPLINGQKMACEPCIRGHRSTKCTHANERLMVPVRKPGRPLSTCPHPPNRGCGCGSVTAAIPRKQKCDCGPSSSSSTTTTTTLSTAENPIKVESPASDLPPLSPSKASTPGSAFRVQKTSSKNTSRKQSMASSNLERMDVSQLNIMPSSYDMSQGIASQTNGGYMGASMGVPTPRTSAEYGQLNQPIMAPDASLQSPIMYPIFQPQMTPMMMSSEAHTAPVTPSTANTPMPATTNGNGAGKSCCSGGSSSNTTKPTPPESKESSPQTEAKPTNGGGCCSSKTRTMPTPISLPGTAMTGTNGETIHGFPTPIALGPQMYAPYYPPHPTLFTYPAHYGSFMSPLQPEQWRQAIEALQQKQQPAAQQLPNFANGAGSLPFDPNAAAATMSSPPMIGTSHECTCGEGCQCVGCAAHPYNAATQEYVRSALGSMVEDGYAHPQTNGAGAVHNNGTHNHHHNDANGLQHLNTTAAPVWSGNPDGETNGEKTGNPSNPQTPSDAASGINEELSENDFFFVSYPLGGDGCLGETLSCPCGDECQCLGCSIHNNPPVAGTE